MAFDHVFWTSKPTPNVCYLDDIVGLKKTFRLHNGVDLASEFGDGAASFSMSADSPDDTLLADHLPNVSTFMVVSDRTRGLLTECAVPNLQFLPVTIHDHKGRALDAKYFVANPVGQIDCLDLTLCQPTYALIKKDLIAKMDRFAVDPAKCGDLPQIFRPKLLARFLLVKRSLAKQLDAAGLTGNGWVEPDRLAGIEIGASLRGMHS
jgi:hypothetical protein